MNRRNFIKKTALGTLGLWGLSNTIGCSPEATIVPNLGGNDDIDDIDGGTTGELYIPPILEKGANDGTRYTLSTIEAKIGSHEFYPEVSSQVVGLSTSSTSGSAGSETDNITHLGPTIRVKRGDEVTFGIKNSLGEDTTNHWHGLHIPGDVDGTPSQIIKDGETWTPTLKIDQEASTNWYHAHKHGSTGKLVHNGQLGMFIIEDDNSTSDNLDIPKEYGVDDIPLIVQDKNFTNQVMTPYPENNNGNLFSGNTIVVNGRAGVQNKTVKNKFIRLRLLNGSNAGVYTFEFSGARSFFVIASDGGFLPEPVAMTSLQMAPGERMEILIDLAQEAGNTITLSAMRRVGNGPMTGFTILNLTVEAASGVVNNNVSASTNLRQMTTTTLNWQNAVRDFASATAPVPASLTMQLRGGRDLDVNYTGGSVSANPGNGAREFEHNTINFSVVEDTDFVVDLSGNNHPFHIHGCSFLVLSKDGDEPPEHERGWKDVLLLEGGVNRILMRFNHLTTAPSSATNDGISVSSAGSLVSDTTAKTNRYNKQYHSTYMFHCHFLEHEDAGMMGQFSVVQA